MDEDQFVEVALEATRRGFLLAGANIRLQAAMMETLTTIAASGQRLNPATANTEFKVASDALNKLAASLEALSPELSEGYESFNHTIRLAGEWSKQPANFRAENPLAIEDVKELTRSVSASADAMLNLLNSITSWRATPALRAAALHAEKVVGAIRERQLQAVGEGQRAIAAIEQVAAE
jgi:hypothetical protein